MIHSRVTRVTKFLILCIIVINLAVRLHGSSHCGISPVVMTSVTKLPNYFDKISNKDLPTPKNTTKLTTVSQKNSISTEYTAFNQNKLINDNQSNVENKHILTMLIDNPISFWWSPSVSKLTKIGVVFSSLMGFYVLCGLGRKLIDVIIKKLRNLIFTIIYMITIVFVFSMVYPILIDLIYNTFSPIEDILNHYKSIWNYIHRHLIEVFIAIITSIVSYIFHGNAMSVMELMWDWLPLGVSTGINIVNYGGQPGHPSCSTSIPSINAVSPTSLQEDVRTHFQQSNEVKECQNISIDESQSIRPSTMEEIVESQIQSVTWEMNETIKSLVDKINKLQKSYMLLSQQIEPKDCLVSRIDAAIKSTEDAQEKREKKYNEAQKRRKFKSTVSFEKHPNVSYSRKYSSSSDSSSTSSSLDAPLAAAMLWREDEQFDVDLVVPALDPNIEIDIQDKATKAPKPIKSTAEEEAIIIKLAGDQVALKTFLKDRKKARVEERKKKELLTDIQQQAQPEDLKIELMQRAHYQSHARLDEDALTVEEKKMSWPKLLRVLKEKSRQRWVEREHRMTGKPKFRCDKCQKITVEGHYCWQANLGRGETRKGVATERKMVVSQSRPGELRLSQKDYVDVPRMQQQYKAIRDVRAQMAEKLEEDLKRNESQQLLSSMNQASDSHINHPVVISNSDHPMNVNTSNQSPLNNNPTSSESKNYSNDRYKRQGQNKFNNPLIGATYPEFYMGDKPSQTINNSQISFPNRQNNRQNIYQNQNRWVSPQNKLDNNDIETFIGQDGRRYMNVLMKNGNCRSVPMPCTLGSQSE